MATGGSVAPKEGLRYAEYLPPSTQRPNADIDHDAVSRRAPLDPRFSSFPSSSVQPTGCRLLGVTLDRPQSPTGSRSAWRGPGGAGRASLGKVVNPGVKNA